MSLKEIASIQFHAIVYIKAVLLWMWFDKTNSMGIFKIQMFIFLDRIFWQWHRWLSPRLRLTPTLCYSTEVDGVLCSAINIILIMKDKKCWYKSNSDSTLFSVTSGFSGLLLCSKYQDNAPNTINHACNIAETAATVITHSKDLQIDNDYTSLPHFHIGLMSRQCQFQGVYAIYEASHENIIVSDTGAAMCWTI